MKTTLDIPNAILQRAKSAAATRGITLREFVTDALKEKLATAPKTATPPKTDEKPWTKYMGKLKHLHKETERINRLI